METISKINSAVNSVVWGPLIIILIIGTGTYLSIMTGFFSITKLGYILKNTLLKMFAKDDKGEGEVTAFQAVATALAATVGTGNIAGVATAMGGPVQYFGCIGSNRYDNHLKLYWLCYGKIDGRS